MSDKKYFSSLYVFVHVLLRIKSEAHHKIIISIHVGLVVHIAVYTETRPGIGSDQYSVSADTLSLGIGIGIGREGKKGIGTSLALS